MLMVNVGQLAMEVDMTKVIERGDLIQARRSTKHLIQGVIYKVIGTTIVGRHYVVRDPYDGSRRYIHKSNVRAA